MAEQELDRSEEATPFKRQEARKKGTVTRSQDVSAAVMAAGLLSVIVFFGAGMMRQELMLFQSFWTGSAGWSFDTAYVARHLASFVWRALVILTPLWLTLIVLALLSGAGQAGIVISTEPLKPDWKRLNPVEGFKRLFSFRMLFEGLKTTLKFTLFVLVLYWAVKSLWPKLLPLSLSNVGGLSQTLAAGSQSVLTRMLVAMLVIAVIDWVYVRREIAKKLRMSRREVRDEVKRREGDPRIKAKLRELRMQFLQRTQSLGKVKDADVLVVNPQHLAVAIKYQREAMQAPQVLAKGAGELALKMREIARRSGVPILENKPLARALFREIKIDGWIPEEHYAAVAKALVWAFRIRHSNTALKGNA